LPDPAQTSSAYSGEVHRSNTPLIAGAEVTKVAGL
jgi:hypothetical protein